MIAVIGGGICGLATAWRLALLGADVTVYERGEPAREATWAAAGYLTPTPGTDAFSIITRESTDEWPAFAAALVEASGADLDYRRAGSIDVVLPECADDVRADFDAQRALGWPVEWLDAAELRKREPAIGDEVDGGLFNPLTHRVDPRLVGPALCAAAERSGVRVRRSSPVERIHIGGGGVDGLTVAGAFIEVSKVILAAGAWASGIAGSPAGVVPVVRPIKGQMAAVRMLVGAPCARHVLRQQTGALVPRGDGRLVIGTTREDVGFDKAVDAAMVAAMIADAARVVPMVASLPVVETWAGLRPFTSREWPVLGETSVPGLYAAIGLGADGIILSPAVSRHLAVIVTGGDAGETIRPFAPPA
jgi:glycine oxidase